MENKFELKVPIKRYFQLIFVFGGAALFMGLLLLFGILSLFFVPDFDFEQGMLGLLIIFPPFFLYSMWLIFGFEKIIIDNNTVELIKSNLIFTKRTKIDLSRIKSVKSTNHYRSDDWFDRIQGRILEMQGAFPFWRKMGQLELRTDTKKITFFNGLSYRQIPKIRMIIENEIKKRTAKN